MNEITLSQMLTSRNTWPDSGRDLEAALGKLDGTPVGMSLRLYQERVLEVIAEASAHTFNAGNLTSYSSYMGLLPSLNKSQVKSILIDSMMDEVVDEVLDSGMLPSARGVTPPKNFKRTRTANAVGRLFL